MTQSTAKFAEKTCGKDTEQALRISSSERAAFVQIKALAAKLFDVAVRQLGMIKNYTENSITDDEMLLLKQYHKLTPIQRKEIIRSMSEK